MTRKKICGIYCIANIINNKKYIGQAQDIEIRWKTHRRELNKNKSNCLFLQLAWNKYGEDNFKFYIINECGIEDLDNLEIYYIKELHSHESEDGYNLSWGGEALFRGRNHSDESREKISNGLKGRLGPNFGKITPEITKRKLSVSCKGKNKGRKHTPEEIEKMSKNRRGIPAKNKGIPMSEEQKQKLKKPKTEEHKRKMSESLKGRKDSTETKLKKSIGMQGIRKSKTSSNKYIGVSKSKNKWRARITVNKIQLELGNFTTEIAAAIVYNKAALLYFGSNARLNNVEE